MDPCKPFVVIRSFEAYYYGNLYSSKELRSFDNEQKQRTRILNPRHVAVGY